MDAARRARFGALLLLAVVAAAGVACTARHAPTPLASASAAATLAASPAAAPTLEPTSTPTRSPGYPTEAPPAGAPSTDLERGWPRDATGPLVVYAYFLAGTPGSPWRVADYDLGARREVASFQVAGELGRDVKATLAGDRVLVDFGHELWSYALDGSDGRLLYSRPDARITNVLLSPHADFVALGEFGTPGTPSNVWVTVVAVADGRVVAHVRQADVFSRPAGELFPSEWTDDAHVRAYIAGGETLDGTADIGTDGSVNVVSPTSGVVTPQPVRVEWSGPFASRCRDAYGASTSLRAVDQSGAVLLALDRGEPVIDWTQLSASFDSVLVGERQLSSAGRALIAAALAEDRCVDVADVATIRADPMRWRLYPLDGGAPRDVTGPLEAEQTWYGDRSLSFVCRGEESPAVRTAERAIPNGVDAERCYAHNEPMGLRVGGRDVASGAWIQVLGFVDAPVASRGAP